MKVIDEPAEVFELTCSQEDGHASVVARGELDATTTHRLRHLLSELLRQPLTRISIDLSAVTFMDSAGLGALVANHGAAERVGIELRVIACSSPVARVMEITGATQRLMASE